MSSRHARPVAWIMALAGAIFLGNGLAQAADAPYTGTWKLSVTPPTQTITVLLVKLENKDGKPQAAVQSAGVPVFQGSKIDSLKQDDAALHFVVKTKNGEFAFAMKVPAGDARPKKLLGTVAIRGQHDFAQMERTEVEKLDEDPRKNIEQEPATRDLQMALQGDDLKKKQTELTALEAKKSGTPFSYLVGIQLLAIMAKNGAAEAEVRALADKLLQFAGSYGPPLRARALQEVTRQILSSNKLPELALGYAEERVKLMDKKAAPPEQIAILKPYATALRRSGKTQQAEEVAARVEGMDAALDKEFAKTAVPFKPEPPPARKSKSNRAVLVELFTGAMCPPCVSADVAFDALLESAKPVDCVLLQYHLHIPGPDPLTNKDSEGRSQFYSIGSTPSILLDGKEGPALGGYKEHGKDRYETLLKAMADNFEEMPGAQIQLDAKQAAGKVTVDARVSEVKKPGDSMRLHLVLAQEVARWPGSNGQRLHHHVVRAFLGGVKGVPVAESSFKTSVSVDLADVHKALNEYLDKKEFDADSRPIDLKQLKVVAFLQDDKTKEVLQAAQINLPESKAETR